MKDKKNILLVCIIILLLVIIILLGILLFKSYLSVYSDTSNLENNTSNNEDSDIQDNENDVVDTVIYNKDEFFDKVEGIWRYVDSDGVNYATAFFENEVGEIRFSNGRYGTDGGMYGVLLDIQYMNDSIYHLTIFSEGCHGDECLEESDDYTYYIDVDITDIDNNKIVITMNSFSYTYYYVADTWEEAEKSFSY